jgi:hypothetical protein
MTSFSEIEPRSPSDRVVDALKDAFLSGELKPGNPLVERELARQMCQADEGWNPCRSRSAGLLARTGIRPPSNEYWHLYHPIYRRGTTSALHSAGGAGTAGTAMGTDTVNGKRSSGTGPPGG